LRALDTTLGRADPANRPPRTRPNGRWALTAAAAIALLAGCAAPVRRPDAPPLTVVEPEPAVPGQRARPIIIKLAPPGEADVEPAEPAAPPPSTPPAATPAPPVPPAAALDAEPPLPLPPEPETGPDALRLSVPPAPGPVPPEAALPERRPPVIVKLPPEPPEEPDAEAPEHDTWVDSTHGLVSRLLDWSAKGVDRAFGDNREVDIKPARTFIAWRNEVRLLRNEQFGFATNLRTQVLLPALNRRLRGLRLLFVSSTPQTDLTYRPLDSAPDAIGRDSAGLRIAFGGSLRWSVDLQGGLLGQWPLGYYGRLRFRRSRPFPFETVGRAAVSGFWQTNTGWGTRQDVSLERLLGQRVLARLSGTGTITEVVHPWTWAGEASVLATFDRAMSLQVAGGPSGSVKTGLPAATWRVRTCLRREVLRRWIFLEVEPHIEWRREVDRRIAEGALVVRAEIQFGTGTVPDLAPPAPVPRAPGPP